MIVSLGMILKSHLCKCVLGMILKSHLYKCVSRCLGWGKWCPATSWGGWPRPGLGSSPVIIWPHNPSSLFVLANFSQKGTLLGTFWGEFKSREYLYDWLLGLLWESSLLIIWAAHPLSACSPADQLSGNRFPCWAGFTTGQVGFNGCRQPGAAAGSRAARWWWAAPPTCELGPARWDVPIGEQPVEGRPAGITVSRMWESSPGGKTDLGLWEAPDLGGKPK